MGQHHLHATLQPAGKSCKDIDGHLAARKLEVLCDGVCDAVVLSLFEKMRAGGGSPEWLARQRRRIEGGIAEMAGLVGKRQWAVGEAFSLGDIAVGTNQAVMVAPGCAARPLSQAQAITQAPPAKPLHATRNQPPCSSALMVKPGL